MQIPVYLKRISQDEFNALIASIPAIVGTGRTIGQAITNARSSLDQIVELNASADRGITIWLPDEINPYCGISEADGCWTSIEYKGPDRNLHAIQLVATASANEQNRRSRPDRRRWLNRRHAAGMEEANTKLIFPATYHHASCITQCIRILMQDRIDESQCNELEIGIMEAITNIVRHAYKNQTIGNIELTYEASPEGISIQFKDAGNPLPSSLLSYVGKDVFGFDARDIGNLPEGGMGVALMHAVFDTVNYAYTDGLNQLTVFKRC